MLLCAQKAKTYTPVENPPTLITKSYKSKNGQGYNRLVERVYYGPLHDAADLFRRNDHRKGINFLDYRKYSKASFYADGVYTMPEEKKAMAMDLFRPLIDSILEAVGAQRQVDIVVFGYTDETPVDLNSASANDISQQLQRYDLSESDYNKYISFLRAREVGQLLSSLLMAESEKLKSFQRIMVDIIMEGRGIEYPDPTRSYELQDDKRKIVKVFWKIRE